MNPEHYEPPKLPGDKTSNTNEDSDLQASASDQAAATDEQQASAIPAAAAPNQPLQGIPQPGTVIGSTEKADAIKTAGAIKRGGKLKKLLIILAVLLIFAGGGGFAYYRWYNSPETVWSQGLERSGIALNEFVDKSFEKADQQDISDVELDGTAEVNYNGTKFSGDLSSKYSKLITDNRLNISFSSQDLDSQEISIDVLTELAENASYPDTFFRISGLEQLGLDGFIPNINRFDGQWISITSKQIGSYIKETEIAEEDFNTNPDKIKPEEVRQLTKTVSNKISEYLLTNDPEKAVLKLDEFMGEETSKEGVLSYRYKVSVNQQNANKFCVDIRNSVLNDPAFKSIFGVSDKQINEFKKDTENSCDDFTRDLLNKAGQKEIWIGKENRLLHKIRVYDVDKAKGYTEMGQIYDGRDKLTVFLNVAVREGGRTDMNLKLESNLSDSSATGSFRFTSKSHDNDLTAKLSFTAKPASGEVKIDRPKDAVNIEQVLEALGLDYMLSQELGL